MEEKREKKFFTASDLASFCNVDLKTIHNWTERGYVAHFRTPGRHLRFKPDDLRAFLVARGYPVPAVLQDGGASDDPMVVARIEAVGDDGSVRITVGGAHIAAIRGMIGGQVTIASVSSP